VEPRTIQHQHLVFCWTAGISSKPDNPLKADVYEFFEDFFEEASHRRHMGVLEATSLADVIIAADASFDWSSLPAEAGRDGLLQLLRLKTAGDHRSPSCCLPGCIMVYVAAVQKQG
jgi:hypothetical protein